MQRQFVRSMVLTSLAALVAIPASAQIRADIGPVHIRIATDAPPRVRYEQRTARPNRDAIWINGSWDRQGDRWAWQTGRWDQPRPRARWVNAKYTREGCPWYRRQNCAWRYVPAHWSNQQILEGDDYRNWRSERYPNRSSRRD